MRFDYQTYEHKNLPNFKGGEGFLDAQMYTDAHTKILRGRLEPGSTVGRHTHEGNCEVIYIISGKGYAIVDGERENLKPGMSTYCPMNSTHELINEGPEDLVFFAVIPELRD